MKARFALFLALLVLVMAGCAGAGDWVSEPLAGSYVILRSSGTHIMLCRTEENGGYSPVVGALIWKAAFNEDFICLQQVDEPAVGEDVPIEPTVYYYIVEVSSGTVYGPYANPEYDEQCKALAISGLIEWYNAKDFRPQ